MARSERCASGSASTLEPVIAQRVDEPDAVSIACGPRGLEIDPARRRGRSEQAHAEASLFVSPVDETQGDGQIAAAVDAECFERGENAQRAVEPAAVRNGIEVRAEDDGLLRTAGRRDPDVAGGVELGLPSDRGKLLRKPRARPLPDRAPRDALGALVVRRQRRQLSKIAG